MTGRGNKMENAFNFIFIYAIFSILLILFGVNDTLATFQEISVPNSFSLGEILQFSGAIFGFFLNLLFYNTPSFILNVIIWAYRVVMILELALYIKRVIHPTAV